jgi:hypothetical protein
METTNESEQKVETQDKSMEAKEDANNSNDREFIERTERVVAELKKQNEVKAKLLEREEKLFARQETLRALGGGSPAGQTPAKPKEETDAEYRDRIMRGR